MSRLSSLDGSRVHCLRPLPCLTRSRPAVAEDAVLLASTVPGYMPGMVCRPRRPVQRAGWCKRDLAVPVGRDDAAGGPLRRYAGEQQVKPGGNSVAMLADMFRLHGVDATMIGGTRSTKMPDPGRPSTTSRSMRSAPAPIVCSRRHRFGSPARQAIRGFTRFVAKAAAGRWAGRRERSGWSGPRTCRSKTAVSSKSPPTARRARR